MWGFGLGEGWLACIMPPKVGPLSLKGYAVSPMDPHRIVVGYDYSAIADQAVKKAFELAARETQAEVHVVSVLVHMGEYVALEATGVMPAQPVLLDDAYEALEAKIGALLATWQGETQKSLSRVAVHVRSEDPAGEIAQLASDLEAQLVVVGTHGRRGLRRLLLGSVAEGVVRRAPCSVFVVRPHGGDVAAVPELEPPCPACLARRRETGGKELWCSEHTGHGRQGRLR